ncbi:MAG: DUF3047 domain-containing protein [Nitrosomonas sp.]|nr:DUF3047 domain-containing protein [Nitrosomonas sp.]
MLYSEKTVPCKTVAIVNKLLCCMMLCVPVLSWAGEERIDVGRFSKSDLSGWQTKVFEGETDYTLEDDGGKIVLRADSSAAASGRYREVSIDLSKTPILNWAWKVKNILAGNDERTRAGDDYPARIYVVFSGGLAFWRTRAINYVWSNRQPIDRSWPNAFTSNARMIAVASGANQIGQWVNVRRDVMADYRRLFGETVERADAVAIMTDTDNTGATATAWYGDIWFSER